MDEGVLVPPYRAIAEEIRNRIERGELRPGDRVPSAREITREWQVAIATASKALALLRDDGVTVARPGVGTVVAHRRVPRPERELTLDRVVRAAIAVADAEGLAETSMRRVAGELGVATMSLYRHVPSKDALLLAMVDAALGDFTPPERRPAGWRAQVELCARLMWGAFRRHAWLAPATSITRPQLAPNGMRLTEYLMAAFDGTPLTLAERLYVQITVFTFVRGVAGALEPEAEAVRETGLSPDEWMATQESFFYQMVAEHRLTHFAALAAEGDFDLDLEVLFRFGLDRLLDGLQTYVAARSRR